MIIDCKGNLKIRCPKQEVLIGLKDRNSNSNPEGVDKQPTERRSINERVSTSETNWKTKSIANLKKVLYNLTRKNSK